MHLQAISEQQVVLDGITRTFAEGEKIHSENSYKYSREEFEVMLRDAGFARISVWTDDAQAFWVFHAA
jgi:uncharacterized SAM-dependent methyltransferase